MRQSHHISHRGAQFLRGADSVGTVSAPTTLPGGFRSLADQLRDWPDDRLTQLLLARPDLATPAPHDSAQLASRAATRSSTLRALDQLSQLELYVLDAVVLAGPTTRTRLADLVHADGPAVTAAVTRLADLALIWESTGGLRSVSGVGEGLNGAREVSISGLRPLSSDPRPTPELVDLLDTLPDEARALLEHVHEHGGEATSGTARQTVSPREAETPAELLLAHRLLLPRPGSTVVVPGEVGIALRGGHTTLERVDRTPEVLTTPRPEAQVDAAAAGAAFDAVRRVELLADHWGATPPAVLRSGGLAVRDLKAVTVLLHVGEAEAALLAETAHAAGLIAVSADTDGSSRWIPTDAYDRWAATPPADRWAALARAWLASPRMPSLVGTRDTAGKAWNALAPEMSGVHMAETRRMTLTVLAELDPGVAPAPGTGPHSVAARVAWLRPRRPRSRADQVAWTLAEAAALGVTGLGSLASYARSLLEEEDPTQALTALLPDPVDHVLLQADLTAVAPGPLESALARRLQLVADVESRGGATTYRFSAGSVRRGLDAGWTAVELHDFLASVSRTGVPQPLTYLVDDTARTFGNLRVGHGEAFVRADDEAALTELLHHPRAGALGLRRLAPTVLISSTPLDVLLPRLRELGAAPVVEAEDGTVRVASRDQARARTPRDERGAGVHRAHLSARVAQVITAVRAGDRAAASRPTDAAPAPLTPTGAMSLLRAAVEAGDSVLIGYLDSAGTVSERLVDPLSVEGGQLRAHDQRADDVRMFAVHRISRVSVVSGP